MVGLISALIKDDKGATAIEYGLIVSLIVIAIVASLYNLAGGVIGMWNHISVTVSSVL